MTHTKKKKINMYRWNGEVSIPKQEYWFLNKVLVVAPLISPLSLDLSRSLSFLSLSLSLDLALYKDLRSIIVKFQRIGLSPLIFSTALQTRPKMKEGPVHFISRSCFPNFFSLEKENSYLFRNISQILCTVYVSFGKIKISWYSTCKNIHAQNSSYLAK